MYNSDGYILIDMSEADITKTNQYIKGIYQRIVNVIDTNKLVLVINAGDLTPMAAVVTKTFNYYVITTQAYIFTINSNDIVIIKQTGEASVDVAIVPTLLDGVKIADYQVGVVSGSIYAPEQQSEINDNTTSTLTTWSSDKINTQLSAKANSSDLATVATTGAYADLSGTPTVPSIDDNAVSSDKVWSSYKTSADLGNKANSSDVYDKTSVDNALADKQNITDNSLTTNNKTVVGGINELNGRFDYSTTEKAVGTWVDGKPIYKKTIYIASMPDGSTKESEYLIGDFLVDMVVDYSSTLFIDDKSQFLPMPYIFTALNTANIQLGFKNKNNKFYVGIRSAGLDRSGARGYVTVYYTKVTT